MGLGREMGLGWRWVGQGEGLGERGLEEIDGLREGDWFGETGLGEETG